MDEREIITRCISGEEEGWNRFLEEYKDLTEKIIYAKLDKIGYKFNIQDIEDIFQDVILTLINNNYYYLRRFNFQCKFKNYLAKITTSRCYDFIRKRKIKIEEDPDVLENLEDKIDIEKTVSQKQILKEFFDKNPKDALLLKLFYNEEMKYKEISEILKIPINTVSSRLNRTKAKLKKFLEEVM